MKGRTDSHLRKRKAVGSPDFRFAAPDSSTQVKLVAQGNGVKALYKYTLLPSTPITSEDVPVEVILWHYVFKGKDFGWHLAVPDWGITFNLTEYHETAPRYTLINED